MAVLDSPCAISPSTSRSRGVNESTGLLLLRTMSCVITSWSMLVPPSATRRNASTNSDTSATRSLSR
jgi:hypothetical protein